MTDPDLDELIHRGDLDGLVRLIDDRTERRDWEGLLRTRDRARHAVVTGRQVWPAATLAEYRLALLGPAEFVAVVLDDTDDLSGRFAIGPLTEVAAQHHTWAELEPHLARGPRSTFVAHERVLRGDTVRSAALTDAIDLPTELFAWEPEYPLATYFDDHVEAPRPALPLPEIEATLPSAAGPVLDDDFVADVRLAFEQLVEPWITSSNGSAAVVCGSDDVFAALRACGISRARAIELAPTTALAWLAWAGASGGAHGRRRGAAAGRFGVWWLVATLADLVADPGVPAAGDAWPPAPDELAAVVDELQWYRWDAFEPDLGWSIRLAVHDPVEDRSWVFTAHDTV